MTGDVGDEARRERTWAAEKRDFVADRRDEMADERDAVADARDRLADEREAVLEERERRLDARDGGLEVAVDGARRAGEAAARERAREERERRGAEREAATGVRERSAALRRASTPVTGLAMAFAELARHLYESEDFGGVLSRIVDAAVATVAGCEMATVTERHEDGFRTVAATDANARGADDTQYEAKEGPCIDAALGETLVHVPVLPDRRWPSLASRPIDYGVRSVASYRLAAPGRTVDGALEGSLNTYGGVPRAFHDEALEIGLVLAAHASVAVRAVREREGLELFGRQLHEALSSRDTIGQAKGILMERLKIPAEEAFDYLRRSSQQLNVKLREVARRLAETGELGLPPEGVGQAR